MIVNIAGMCLTGCVLCVLLRQSGKNEMAFMTALGVTIYVFVAVFQYVSGVIGIVENLSQSAGLDTGIFKTVIKITGIAYISQMASELCKDAGEGALSGKVELGGKVLICAEALPAVSALFNIISDFI